MAKKKNIFSADGQEDYGFFSYWQIKNKQKI